MRKLALFSLICALALLLTSCSNQPVKRVFPPQASLQQLQRIDNAQWQAQIRLQSFSTATIDYQNLSLQIQLQDLEWISVSHTGAIQVAANNAEIVNINIIIPMNVQKTLNDRSNLNQSIRYVLKGQIESIDPNKTYQLDYQGRLNPAPGLNGVFR